MTSTPCLNDIIRSLSRIIVSEYLHMCLNQSPFSLGSLMLRRKQYNFEEDDS